MSKLSKSNKSIFIELKSGSFVCYAFEILQNTIDLLPDTTFVRLVEYFRNYYDLVTIKITRNQLFFIIGSFDISDEPTFSEHYSKILRHIQQMKLSNIDFLPLSPYELNILSNEKKLPNNILQVDDMYYKLFAISSLTISSFHSKILRMLTEIQGLSVTFCITAFKEIKYHLGISLSANTQDGLLQNCEDLISNLQSSPLINGELHELSRKYLISHPGMASLGISKHSISFQTFIRLVELIPTSLLAPNIPKIPQPHSLVVPPQELKNKIVGSLPAIEIDDELLGLFQKYNWEIEWTAQDSIHSLINADLEVNLVKLGENQTLLGLKFKTQIQLD